jgi:hypothetical protein
VLTPLRQKSSCISLLGKLLGGAQLLIQLVNGLQPKLKNTPGRAPKRAKVVECVAMLSFYFSRVNHWRREDASDSESLESLAFLAEVLSGISLPGDRDLISCLLETLGNVSRSEGRPTAGVAYVEQLLMSCIQNVSATAQVKPFKNWEVGS